MAKTKRPAPTSKIQKQIGQHIQWVREASGHTQSDLARLLDIDASTVNKIENGSRAASIFFLIEVALRYRASVDLLALGRVTGVEDPRLIAKIVAAHPALAEGIQTLEADMDKSMVFRTVLEHSGPTETS